MPTRGIGLADRLNVLRKASRRSRLAALIEALRVCGPQEADAITRALLGEIRAGDRAIDALAVAALRWERLKEPTRAMWLAAAGDRLSAMVDNLSKSTSGEQRLAAAELIAHMPSATGVARLPGLLLDDESEVGDAAEGAIRKALLAAYTDEALRAVLDATLADAATSYPDHRKRGVLEVIVPMLDGPSPRLREWLGDTSQPALLALRSVVRGDRSEGSRARSLRLLAVPSLAPAAAARLSKRAGPREHQRAFECAHLLAREARREEFARVRVEPTVDALPSAKELALMPEQARAGHARFVASVAMPAARRAALLAPALSDPSELVRVVAVRELTRERVRDADDAIATAGLLADLCFVGGGASARLASSALVNDRRLRRAVQAETRAAMSRSRHESVRVAREIADRHEDPFVNPAAARIALDATRATFTRELVRRIARGDAQGKVAAMRIARRLSLTRDAELEILAAATDRDARVAATAAAALADIAGSSASQALERLVEHPDERVRANAIEALGEQRPLHPLVEVKLAALTARERANAARSALLASPNHGRATETLESMLRAEDRSRQSGLWAIERARTVALAPAVAKVVREASDEHTLRRAKAAARMLLAVMQPVGSGRGQSARPNGPIAKSEAA
jgi:hypothetical protein